MAHSDAVNFDGWKAAIVQFGLLVVGAFSVLILFSFGGQVVAAPVLLPAQWIIARDTTGKVSTSFSLLGAALLAEVVYLVFSLIVGDNAVMLVAGLPVALGAGYLFFRTSRRASEAR